MGRNDAARAAKAPELSLSAEGEGAQEHLRVLFEWLTREDQLRGDLTLRREPAVPGQMGGMLEALAVTVGSSGAVAVLARSLSVWLVQRKSDVRITVKSPSGRQVMVDVRRARDPQAVIQDIAALIEKAESEPTP
ncbi:effector-associated constant component EACC1 [Streptomyces sp. URMC 127]|uniref:effector-associated constant component EACC1 n=1 Tax=Streptomyces sp. URMC 127 TaxID=3423402 RepID=UPI003F1E05C2